MIMTKPRRGFFSAEWTRTVQLSDGRVFYVSLTRGKRVRIPFKKRGQNVGYQWIGSVRSRQSGRTRCSAPRSISGCRMKQGAKTMPASATAISVSSMPLFEWNGPV